MEFHVTQENLNKALQTVARIANSRGTLPILGNILFKIKNKRLCVSATNLDIAISEFVGAKIINEGSLTIPARLTQDLISSLPPETIEIKQNDHKLHITSGSYSSIINGVAADEFPVMPAIDDGEEWSIPANVFKKALQQVVFAASNDETRPVLTGVYFHSQQKNLYIAATDSYRLAEKTITKNPSKSSLIVPATAANDLLRIISDDDQQILVQHNDQQVLFKISETELIARLIEGKYPDYKKLIPKNFQVTAELDKQELVNIVKVSSLFARESAGGIKLIIDQKEQNLSIKSIASQVGENNASAPAKVKGSGEITLNSRYILDGLQSIDSKVVSMGFNGKLDPVVLQGVDEKEYVHIVMPLKS